MHSEGGGAFAAARRRFDGGGRGLGRGKGQEERGERGGAHQGLDLGGEDLGEGARRRGVEFGATAMADEVLQLDFGRGNDSSRHGMERSEVGARLRSLGCDESRRDGEPWPARRTAATRARALRNNSGKG